MGLSALLMQEKEFRIMRAYRPFALLHLDLICDEILLFLKDCPLDLYLFIFCKNSEALFGNLFWPQIQ